MLRKIKCQLDNGEIFDKLITQSGGRLVNPYQTIPVRIEAHGITELVAVCPSEDTIVKWIDGEGNSRIISFKEGESYAISRRYILW